MKVAVIEAVALCLAGCNRGRAWVAHDIEGSIAPLTTAIYCGNIVL